MAGALPEFVRFHDSQTGNDYTIPYSAVRETWDELTRNLRRNPGRDELLAAIVRRVDAGQN
jgi:hypothetical protein